MSDNYLDNLAEDELARKQAEQKAKGNGKEPTSKELPGGTRTDEDILVEVAKLDDIAYDQGRDALAKELSVRVTTLDVLRKKERKESAEDDAPSLFLSTPKPCSGAVDGSELLNEIVAVFNKYLVLPDGAAEAMALWVIHTYCHDAAWIGPILTLLSPTKQCGKTTSLNLLSYIVDKPLPASNLTAPTLFRGIEKYIPTLLLDEADTFMRDNEEMRGVLNSGHNRASAQVLRAVPSGDDYDVKPFSTWCPKSVAAIGKLPATLMDRSIVIPMQRKKKSDNVERLRGDKAHEFEPLRARCARWALDNFDAIKATDPPIPERLGDREADNWRTLLSIADTAGWDEIARTAIKNLIPEKAEDDDIGVKLLADIKKIFDGRDLMASADIVFELNQIEESPWPSFFKGKGINAQRVASMLGKHGIKPKLERDLGQKRGYRKANFLGVWDIYLPDPPDSGKSAVTPLQVNNSAAFSNQAGVTDDACVTATKRPEAAPIKGCNTVTPIYPDMEASEASMASEEYGPSQDGEDVKEWLRKALAKGPVDSGDIEQLALNEGHSERTLFRAKKELGVKSRRPKGKRTWQWYLPDQGCQGTPPNNIGNIGNVGKLNGQDSQGCQDGHLLYGGQSGNVAD